MERLKTVAILALLAALAGSIALAATSGETEVRITARQLANGRVEFGLQQRVDGEWGERILPSSRYFPANVGHSRWLNSTPMTVRVAATNEAANDLTGEPIIFSNLNWTSAEVQNQIVSYIVSNGYGYPVDLIDGDTVSLWQGLINGDTHVTMEIWPAQQEWIDALEDSSVITLLGDSLDENWEGWVIPQYVKDQNPGLVSVTDIPDYAELFVAAGSRGKARFISCVAGWACAQVNEEKFDSYGLRHSLHIVNPGSGAALFADLEASYARGDAWLGYIWGPTKPTETLDLYRLEEPEWTAGCWRSGKACAYPASTVRIAVASELLDRAPDVVEFLRAWDFKSREYIGTDIWMSDNDETPEAAALYYLRTYRDVWSAFVPADVAAQVDAALAGEG